MGEGFLHRARSLVRLRGLEKSGGEGHRVVVLLVETLHGAVVPVLRLRWNGRDQLEGLTSEPLLELDEADRVGDAREGVEGDRGVLPLSDPAAVASEDLRGLAFAVEDR